MNARKPSRPAFRLTMSFLLVIFLAVGCAGKSSSRRPVLSDDALFRADLAAAALQGGLTIVAPASGLSEPRARALGELAARLGLTLPPETLAPDLLPYHANTDEIRLALLGQALTDPQTRVVWAMRGGYGSSRIIEGLGRLPRTDKIFVGYSDLTFVHLYLNRAGRPSIHGAMFSELDNPAKDAENFRLLAGLWSGRLTELDYQGLQPYNEAARQSRRPIRAALTGGNLTCLAASVGTPWALEASGRILVIEDVAEPGYKIDRLLTQLKESGRLKEARAVIIGSFTGDGSYIEYALKRFADDFGRPVFKTDLFGHGPRNYPLIFNTPATISPDADGQTFRLKIKSPFNQTPRY